MGKTTARQADKKQANRKQADRKQWMAALAKAPLPLLDELVAKVDVPGYRFLRSPETGLTMVRGRAGGVGQVFNLGEMTLTRCVVQLFDYPSDGSCSPSSVEQSQPIAGFGYVAGRSHRHAELAAVCDGLLQHRDWHRLVKLEVLDPLGAIAKEQNAQKQQRTAATKVDFFTLLRGE